MRRAAVTTISVIYHSPRETTHEQALAVVEGARAVPGVTVHAIRIDKAQIKDGHWHDAEALAKLNASDGIVFGSVTYFGMVSGPFKTFLDATFGLWAQQAWKDKFAGGFTNSAAFNGDKQVTLMQLLTYAAQMAMIWVPVGDHPGANWSGASQSDVNRTGSFLGPSAQTDSDADQAHPADLETARRYGQRFAEIVRHWKREGDYTTERNMDKATIAAVRKRGQTAVPQRVA
jgi:NAD(P)H dehydrogenase (quinone)